MTIIRDPRLPRFTHDQIMGLTRTAEHEWRARDVMLYALGIGLGADPLDERELDFVYEKNLKVMPTFPVVVGFEGGPLDDIPTDYRYVLHGEHAVTLHRPFPASGVAIAEGKILGAWDKGAGKGAVFLQEKILRLPEETEPLATLRTTAFARADGGFGGPNSGQPEPHRIPERVPDHVVRLTTAQNQALIYRLSGDLNPLHADPAAAKAAGFDRPILHGLCTFALCCRAILATYCHFDPERIAHHEVRFSSPVWPGETVSVRLWKDGNIVSFEAAVEDRGVTVIRNGKTILRDARHLGRA